MSIFTGVILGKNDDGTYRLQPTRTMHPYNRVPGMDGAVYGVGEEVPYGLIGGDPQRPQILARTVRSWPIAAKMTGWHCYGYDGRRSFAVEDSSALPPSVLGSTTPAVDDAWLPEGGIPLRLDETTGTIGGTSKLLTLEGIPRNYPSGFNVWGPWYVRDGKAYLEGPVRCMDIATGAISWVSPNDPDGIQGWTGACVSDDGSALYSYAEKDVGSDRFDLWVRAQATKDGSVLWRTKASQAPYKRNGTDGIVYDGTSLYIRFTPHAEDTVTDIDLSGLHYVGGYGYDVNARQYSAAVTEHHVVAVKATGGARLWEVVLPNVKDATASNLMMIGAHVAFSYARITLPSSSTLHAHLEAGSYVTEQSHTTVYYPEMKIATLDGLALEWRLARISFDGTLSETGFEQEDYAVDAYSGALMVPVGSRPNRLGLLFTGLWPSLSAASRDGSIVIITKSMDASGASGTYYAHDVTTVEAAYPDYWTSGRDEWGGPPYAPVMTGTAMTYEKPFTIWPGSQGGIGVPEEFVPPDPGSAPFIRYYLHGGTMFGGNSAGMTTLLEGGAEDGSRTLLARITAAGLGTYTAIPTLPLFYNPIAANGYIYTWDGTHTRRFK